MVARRSDEEWQIKAACRGPQAVTFFPPAHVERKDDRAERERAAKAICRTCPVRRPCLEESLRIREPHGVWGGLNELERKQLLDRRAG
ncbi:MAG: Transcription factor WhiB [Acidimicrobiaceae bacterium]|nr:Transcription factor WhiB [Acidimicrobiaceae bacterium]